MKLVFTLLLVISIFNTCLAQKGYVKYIKVLRNTYQIQHREAGALTGAVLIFDGQESIYYAQKKGLNEEASDQNRLLELFNKGDNISDVELDEMMEYAQQRSDGSMHFSIPPYFDKIGIFNHISLSTDTLTSRVGDFKKKYIVKEPLPNLRWVFHEGEKQLGNHLCKKASLFFRGRTYEAWYAIDIPVSFGPFKMFGLPGLIMELNTADGRVTFRAVTIDIPYNGNNNAQIPKLNFKKDKLLLLSKYVEMINNSRQLHLRGLEAEGIDPDTQFEDLERIFWVPKNR